MNLFEAFFCSWYIFDGLRQTLGLRRKLVVSVKNPTRILIPHWEEWSRHVVTDSDPLVASSLRVFCARNSQNTRKEGRSLSRHVGIILLSGGWEFVWGSSRGLQVFYVIQGSGVIVHIDLWGEDKVTTYQTYYRHQDLN